MPAESDELALSTPRLIIVTGVSGSGRASAMRVLEDLGFYCVDNLPVALAPNVAMLAAGRDPALQGRRARSRFARTAVLSAMAARYSRSSTPPEFIPK